MKRLGNRNYSIDDDLENIYESMLVENRGPNGETRTIFNPKTGKMEWDVNSIPRNQQPQQTQQTQQTQQNQVAVNKTPTGYTSNVSGVGHNTTPNVYNQTGQQTQQTQQPQQNQVIKQLQTQIANLQAQLNKLTGGR